MIKETINTEKENHELHDQKKSKNSKSKKLSWIKWILGIVGLLTLFIIFQFYQFQNNSKLRREAMMLQETKLKEFYQSQGLSEEEISQKLIEERRNSFSMEGESSIFRTIMRTVGRLTGGGGRPPGVGGRPPGGIPSEFRTR